MAFLGQSGTVPGMANLCCCVTCGLQEEHVLGCVGYLEAFPVTGAREMAQTLKFVLQTEVWKTHFQFGLNPTVLLNKLSFKNRDECCCQLKAAK